MASKRGDAYRVARNASEGRGTILESWEQKITPEEFEAKQDYEVWFEADKKGIGFSFIWADILQVGSMSAPEIFGVFIPSSVNKRTVADHLREIWGEATELRRPN